MVYADAMQVTLDIPDTLAAELAAAGKDPALSALELLEDWSVLQAIQRGREDIAAGRVRSAEEVFAEMRQKHGIPL